MKGQPDSDSGVSNLKVLIFKNRFKVQDGPPLLAGFGNKKQLVVECQRGLNFDVFQSLFLEEGIQYMYLLQVAVSEGFGMSIPY